MQLVSILIPAFNAEALIAESIGSALAQSWRRKEVIVVDDGSNDGTYKAAKALEGGQVKVVRQENRGASAARNTALKFAQGDYIQWLDADDLLAPDKIERQMASAEAGSSSRILLSSSFARFFRRPERARFVPNLLWKDLLPVDWLVTRFAHRGVWLPTISWLMSRRLCGLAGPWNEKLSFDDDGEYFCRVVSLSEAVRFVPDARCYYRHSNGLSSDLSAKTVDSSVLSVSRCVGYLLGLEDSDRTRAASFEFIHNRAHQLALDTPRAIDGFNELAQSYGMAELAAPKQKLRTYILKSLLGRTAYARLRRRWWAVKIEVRGSLESLACKSL